MKTQKILTLLTTATLAMGIASGAAFADNHGKDGMHKRGNHKGKMFEKMDMNSDGTITESEFIEASKERFEKMDMNNDGSVTKDEAREAGDKWREKMKEKREKRAE